MIGVILNEQQLQAVCDVLGETYNGLSKAEITRLLQQSRIEVLPDGSTNNGYTYSIGLNKRTWLFNCLANECNQSKSLDKVYSFMENALNPILYVGEDKRGKYNFLYEEINKVLLLVGLHMTREGHLEGVKEAKTLDEVDRRVNSLKKKLYDRGIHDEVQKYCIADYLRKDYYDAVFEAAKGLAERVREITGLTLDGGKLFQTAFAKNDPYIVFNSLSTESEKNEFTGVRELLEAIFHLVRNPAAHTPKINWITDEMKALDTLTLISVAHKYLDVCYRMPGK